MNGFDSCLTSRAWQQNMRRSSSFPVAGGVPPPPSNKTFSDLMGKDDDLVSSVVPSVTVVLEGRSICHRINLYKHSSYKSLARALRKMFVHENEDHQNAATSENDLDLSNAIPGHLIAYEDMENDLLLAGDLNWKDFIRVAKRIRIVPEKGSAKKKSPKVRGDV